MSSSTSSPFLYLLSFALLLHVQTILGVDPLYHICSSSGKQFTPNFENNLNNVINTLSRDAPQTGFSRSSAGAKDDDSAYGLALCRGDTSSANCKSCITEAREEIKNRCKNNKGAIIWYDYCLLKYSDENFFGKIDETNKFYLYNVYTLTNSTLFVAKTNEFLSGLSQKAVQSEKLYYANEEKLCNEFLTLYGLVQCTRDLSSEDCLKCLDDAIRDLPIYSAGKQGGRTIYGSCNVRYEIYPFVKD
ncbi:cysteine-rich repeat secretory protein 38-like [Malania oleifera]|uniref:cysteine-rich repeat secretory protein 38-like n=1 Tax=Malania oleifera TaxID=397392 RepID=UPI0025ADA5DA|nr:cysteine-rich repeat secretory protein 38-like [Malania oleifera]